MPPTIETTAIRNVTPIATPSSVKKLLSFCTRIWARASRMASKIGICLKTSDFSTEFQTKRRLQTSSANGVGKRRFHSPEPEPASERVASFVGGDQTVSQYDHPAGVLRDVGFVRDHNDGLPGVCERLEHLHDFFRRLRVEVTGRLVGQEDGG